MKLCQTVLFYPHSDDPAHAAEPLVGIVTKVFENTTVQTRKQGGATIKTPMVHLTVFDGNGAHGQVNVVAVEGEAIKPEHHYCVPA